MAQRGDISRYSRQIRFAAIGEEGQLRLLSARVLVIGLGALGSCSSELLARAGVGFLRIVDRDFVDLSNLQRQSLYHEDHARQGFPKAIAAAERLRQINSDISVEPHVADVTFRNIESLSEGIDLIIDGTDNFEVRFLINDLSVSRGIPWIYGGCLGSDGQSMNVLPGETACLRCLMPEGPPPSGQVPTCDNAGVIGPIVTWIASLQACEAIKLLSGNRQAMSRDLRAFSLWDNRFRSLQINRRVGGVSDRKTESFDVASCPTCVGRDFVWLRGELGSESVVLCGRNAVQISPNQWNTTSFATIAKGLAEGQPVQITPYFLRVRVEGYELTLFTDGRAIISGTDQIHVAKSLYARLIGN